MDILLYVGGYLHLLAPRAPITDFSFPRRVQSGISPRTVNLSKPLNGSSLDDSVLHPHPLPWRSYSHRPWQPSAVRGHALSSQQ